MEKTSLSSGIYSHPGIPLEEHLRRVAEFTDLFLREERTARDGELRQVCRVIALVHDIGKATGYFQDYLKLANQSPGKTVSFCRRKASHSFFSAICAYYLVKELNLPDKFYPLFAFLATRRHHSDLVDVRDEVNFADKDRALLFDQLQRIPTQGFSFLCQEIKSLGLPVLLNKEIIAGWIDEFIKNESRELRRAIRNLNGDVDNYILLNFIYSLLLDADKSAVVVKKIEPFQRGKLNGVEWVNNFRQRVGFRQSPLNKLRDEIYEEVNAKDVDLSQWVYSLNLPTGMGKTITAFAFALKLREALKSRYGVVARIIYSLPYLSIIDQNADVLKSVIGANIPRVTNDILLSHHHLTDIFYRSREEEFSGDEAEILIEGWNSEIVITTFVQLFHTLISNRKNSIRKFHRLANSILILDEIQSIPIKYWLLLHNVLTALRRQLNVYVIFVTATEPLIFENSETTPLISAREKYFNILNRVVLKPLIQREMTLDDLTKRFPLDDDRSYLFIFNTITAAREFYDLLKKRGIKGACTYLSTHIVPSARRKRIKEIKEEKKYRVVVSTQLVEAGVDIDFDVVVRDIAPLDSINQSAGRCNRNALGKGEVYVVKLVNKSGGRTYASYIYDPILLDITEQILSGREEIEESDFLNLVNLYYQQTSQRKSQDKSRSLLEAITNLRYDSDEEKIKIADFALIEEDYNRIDVFIELDEQAEKVWKEYIGLQNITDRFERKRKFEEIKNEFYQYVISIPRSVRNKPEMVGEIGYVKRSLIGDCYSYYSEETGYITTDTKSEVIC